MSARRLVVLGSTGSIGTQTLEVVRTHPDRFVVVGLAAGRDAETVADQAAEFNVREIALADREAASRLRELLPDARVRDGLAGVAELAGLGSADVVVNGIVGAQGLTATLAALEAGHTLALANKESLIVGGELVLSAAGPRNGPVGLPDGLVPVDSEHSALAQCLRGGHGDEVARLILTASGGPFHGRPRKQLVGVTAEEALAHPTWDMGPVITVNSATLANKGLELIEAHLLFGIRWEALEVVVHPQSVVHSMVEFCDGATLAQLSPPDMRLAIQAALGWPQRPPHAFAAMDWDEELELTFEPVDRATFEMLDLCVAAGRRAGTYPAVLNAANEQAVSAFLEGRLGFLDLPAIVGDALEAHDQPPGSRPPTLDEIRDADRWARRWVETRLDNRSVTSAGVTPTPREV